MDNLKDFDDSVDGLVHAIAGVLHGLGYDVFFAFSAGETDVDGNTLISAYNNFGSPQMLDALIESIERKKQRLFAVERELE